MPRPPRSRTMRATLIRPQRNITALDGALCKAWELEYLGSTFYIQKTGDGDYQVIEETRPGGYWMPVQPERQEQILLQFESARRRSSL